MAINNGIWDSDQAVSECKRRRVSSESANVSPMSDLAIDLLDQILIRLPNPRVACRCKLVCKRWDSHISTPRFNRLFVSHHQTATATAPMPDNPYELQSRILSFLPPMDTSSRVGGDGFRVLDCNKDLVLCGFWDADYQSSESSRAYLVCNPFTKQWVLLPLAPRKSGRYQSLAPRLVCEPRISIQLDLGQGQAFVYSEYRFRVVCLYRAIPEGTIKLDVFCSESGGWTKEAFVSDRPAITAPRCVISCNGELFWMYAERLANNRFKACVAGFNPFRLDMPPTCIDVSVFLGKPRWFISNSQGALHVIAHENKTLPIRSSVWRLEEDRKSWRKQCEGVVNKTSTCGNYKAEGCYSPLLHPHEPGLVFFARVVGAHNNALMCCDLRREQVQLFAKLEYELDVHRLQVFQPRVSCCWATPIPRYKEFQAMYDGSSSLAEANCPSLHVLHNCMGRVAKSAFYKNYMQHVLLEAVLNLVAEIMRRRMNKTGEIVDGAKLAPRSPNFDHEWDVLVAALKDVGVDSAAIVEQKEVLKQALLREIPELPYPPPGPIKSVFWREASRGGLKPTLAVLGRGMNTLKQKEEGKAVGNLWEEFYNYNRGLNSLKQKEDGKAVGNLWEEFYNYNRGMNSLKQKEDPSLALLEEFYDYMRRQKERLESGTR